METLAFGGLVRGGWIRTPGALPCGRLIIHPRKVSLEGLYSGPGGMRDEGAKRERRAEVCKVLFAHLLCSLGSSQPSGVAAEYEGCVRVHDTFMSGHVRTVWVLKQNRNALYMCGRKGIMQVAGTFDS